MAMTAEASPTLEAIYKEVMEVRSHAFGIVEHINEIGDYLGGGAPRGVDASSDKAPTPMGMVQRIMQMIGELRGAQSDTLNSLARVDALLGRSRAASNQIPNYLRGGIGTGVGEIGYTSGAARSDRLPGY